VIRPLRWAVAAQRKRDHALEHAHSALRDLNQRGETISFQAVARAAGVSRQWLYTQPELRVEIERLRARQPDTATRVPDAERAREASLRQRSTMLLAENRRLRDQIAELKAELAIAYGHQRAAH
jgi:hypothetical protein